VNSAAESKEAIVGYPKWLLELNIYQPSTPGASRVPVPAIAEQMGAMR
jgi:hypothetical protein